MSLARSYRLFRRALPRKQPAFRRPYSTADTPPPPPPAQPPKAKSSHARFYYEMVPGMLPVALLGSAVYLGLRLLQSTLAHQRYLVEVHERLDALTKEVESKSEEIRKAVREGVVPTDGAKESQPSPSEAVSPAPAATKRGWFW